MAWEDRVVADASVSVAAPKPDPLFFESMGVPFTQGAFASFSQPTPIAVSEPKASVADGPQGSAAADPASSSALVDQGEEFVASDNDADPDRAENVSGMQQEPPADHADVLLDALPAELLAADVRDRSYGFGIEGASVQPQGQQHGTYSDRDIVRNTLLRGLPKVPAKLACDCMRAKVDGKGSRKALSQTTWRTVMEAAAAQCSILRVEGQGKASQLVVKAIPATASDRIAYHNELMQVCGLSLRAFVESMNRAKQRREEQSVRGNTADHEGNPEADVLPPDHKKPRVSTDA